MNFAFSEEQQRFRQHVHEFFAEPYVQELLQPAHTAAPREEVHPDQVYRWLGERGWLAPAWPTAYGGLGKTVVESAIVMEEMGLAGVPDTVRTNTIDIVGLFILLAGTPEQKQRFLPRMAKGDLIATVLYSEPDAGSDMSGLTTRAERSGNGFKLYGRKIYSLKSFMADYGIVSARTAPGTDPNTSISLFLVPLDAEGVSVNRMLNISDESFGDVTFDGLFVSADNVIGTLNQGWRLLNAALSLERTGLDFNVKVRRWFDLALAHGAATGQLDNPLVGQTVARLRGQIEAGRLMGWRVVSQLARDQLDPVASAMSKWYNTELARPVMQLALDMDGLEGTLSRWDGQAPLGGVLEAAQRETPGLTLSAGTSEIMLYLISGNILQAK